MPDEADRIRLSIDLPLAPQTAFDVVARELAAALARHGIHFEPASDGRISDGDLVVGEVAAWTPGHRAALRWLPAPWQPELATEIELTVSATESGSAVTVEHHGWSHVVTDSQERAEWFAGEVASSFLRATAPRAFGDWLTDRRARRPSGAQSRATYADPLYHYPHFRVILAELALTRDDSLLEVGCGGGAMLRLALASGCRAAAIDHSTEIPFQATKASRNPSATSASRESSGLGSPTSAPATINAEIRSAAMPIHVNRPPEEPAEKSAEIAARTPPAPSSSQAAQRSSALSIAAGG